MSRRQLTGPERLLREARRVTRVLWREMNGHDRRCVECDAAFRSQYRSVCRLDPILLDAWHAAWAWESALAWLIEGKVPREGLVERWAGDVNVNEVWTWPVAA